MSRPHFLICNDDGIDSPGIRYLWECAKDLGDCTIVAPAENQTSQGASTTIYQQFHVEAADWGDSVSAWKVHGTPVDAVKVGLELCQNHRPTMILSGINHGGNHGKNVLYSGTIAATIHGTIHGIPGIAFSQICKEVGVPDPAYQHTLKYIPRIILYFQQHKIPLHTIINVNFPHSASGDYRGIAFARQGNSYWHQDVDELISDGHKRTYLHRGQWTHDEVHDKSDSVLLDQGYITITPVKIHDLTDQDFFDAHHDKMSHFDDLFTFDTVDTHPACEEHPAEELP